MPDADWGQTLLAHFSTHPQAQVTDLVKFAYQTAFGGGHLIRDEAEALRYIRTETEERMAENFSQPAEHVLDLALCEPVGNGLCRLNLVPAASLGMRPETVARMFAASARDIRGTQEDYRQRLDLLVRFCREGALPFPTDDMELFVRDHIAQGCLAVSHSPVYRDAYHPAYRIVRSAYVELWQVIQAIDLRLEQKRAGDKALVVAIEGPCGSGKSTMAAGLRDLYGEGTEVIHLDDFFLPPELQTEERYAEPGGNIHYERFKTEVADALRAGGTFSYRVYDCTTRAYAASPVTVHPVQLVVVEGVYGMHPAIGLSTDLTVFLSLSREEQKSRVQQRSGPVLWKRFEAEWIPMENQYFRTFRILERCDLVLGDPY